VGVPPGTKDLRPKTPLTLQVLGLNFWHFNPLTPGDFCKKHGFFLDILAVFRLKKDFSQISFNLVKNAFVRRQFAVLATSITCYDILARACL